MLELVENFASNYYCRICIGVKDKLDKQYKEDISLLRKQGDYLNHLEHQLYGVKDKCVWNGLKYFHIYENRSCDIMHDLFEGVHRYDLAHILKGLIDTKQFTLQTLNTRIKYTAYEYSERNILPSIKVNH